jgi:uncharacterized linocin/CFP29 family protein
MDPAVNVDMLTVNASNGNVGATGFVAQALAGGFNVNRLRPAGQNESLQPDGTLRANATLMIREWIQLDTAVINVARRRLVGIQDLISAGLTYTVADAMGVTRLEWQKIGVMTGADVSMSGISNSQNDRQEYGTDALPIPIIHKEFTMNLRQLASTRRMGTPLDVTQAELCSRLVSEKIETMLFLGSTVLGSNRPIYGYETQPNRATGSVTASWASAATGPQMLTDLLAMIQKLKDNNMYGPYGLYVPSAAFTRMGNDYVTTANLAVSTMARLLQTPGISFIKESKDLTSSNIILVQLTSDVVDLVDGMQPTTVQWDSPGGFQVNFKVMAILIPRVKADYVNQSGVCHYS